MKNFLTQFILSALVICFSNSVNSQLTSGLQGYWTFDGNADDVSGNNNNGVVYGATLSPDRFGRPDMAYCFDGINDYIKTAFSGVSGPTSRTLSFWAKIPSTGNNVSTSGYEFFSYGDNPGTAPGGSFRLVLNRNCQGIGVNIGSAVKVTSNTLSTLDAWHHYVVIYDQSVSTQLINIKIYLDGALVTNTNCDTYFTSTNVNTQTSQPIHFGRLFLLNDGRFFNGCLDDFRMYDRAVTNIEVGLLYNYSDLSVKSNESNIDLKIYPNPTNNYLSIETISDQLERIIIQTLEGKTVFESQFMNKIDVGELCSGVYIISFMDGNKSILKNLKFSKL